MATPDYVPEVLTEIRAEMARLRRTQGDLARHLQLAEPAISRRMNGTVPMTLPEFLTVSAWLGLTPQDLLTRAARPDRTQVSA